MQQVCCSDLHHQGVGSLLTRHFIPQNPSDPSRIDQRFHRSFMAVFESAVELISIVKQMVIFHPSLVAR